LSSKLAFLFITNVYKISNKGDHAMVANTSKTIKGGRMFQELRQFMLIKSQSKRSSVFLK